MSLSGRHGGPAFPLRRPVREPQRARVEVQVQVAATFHFRPPLAVAPGRAGGLPAAPVRHPPVPIPFRDRHPHRLPQEAPAAAGAPRAGEGAAGEGGAGHGGPTTEDAPAAPAEQDAAPPPPEPAPPSPAAAAAHSHVQDKRERLGATVQRLERQRLGDALETAEELVPHDGQGPRPRGAGGLRQRHGVRGFGHEQFVFHPIGATEGHQNGQVSYTWKAYPKHRLASRSAEYNVSGGGSDRYGYCTQRQPSARAPREYDLESRDVEESDRQYHRSVKEGSVKRGQFTRSLSNNDPPLEEKAGEGSRSGAPQGTWQIRPGTLTTRLRKSRCVTEDTRMLHENCCLNNRTVYKFYVTFCGKAVANAAPVIAKYLEPFDSQIVFVRSGMLRLFALLSTFNDLNSNWQRLAASCAEKGFFRKRLGSSSALESCRNLTFPKIQYLHCIFN